jgi:hypothetical protein
MFRLRNRQKTIFDHDVYLPKERVASLEETWAGPFRLNILPLISEDPFRPFYCKDNGRPNVPVAILIGLCILKEWYELTDSELLGSLEWDVRFQYALDINLFEADICQKTLHNFRSLVAKNQMAGKIFSDVTAKIIAAAGLSTDKQRLDSTHIVSNMKSLTRLGLFVRTIEKFLKKLEKSLPEVFAKLPAHYRVDYVERSGYFADVKSGQAQRRLEKCAGHLFDLVDRFKGDAAVSHLHSYKLLARLLSEQCEITHNPDEPALLKKPAEVDAASLQNPSDPDATYGHKGKGYKASLTETCGAENAFQIITDVAVDGANIPDSKDIVPVLKRLEENGVKPQELFADAGYGSGDNFLDAKASGVDLTAPMTSGGKADENRVRVEDFTFDNNWTRVLSCLKNHAPVESGLIEEGKFVFAVFHQEHCEKCDFKDICQVKRNKNGKFYFKAQRKTVAAAHRRTEQETPDFKERYKIRSGIEATISEANRLTGIKRSWTRGASRVTAATIFKALAVNIKRFVAYRAEKAKNALARLFFGPNSDENRAACPPIFDFPTTALRILKFSADLPLAA